MENKEIQSVEWTEKCPCCKKEITFKITKRDRSYTSYIVRGCEHFAVGFVDQCKYRQVVNMLKQLYNEPDLVFSTYKKREQIEKARMLGRDISNYI